MIAKQYLSAAELSALTQRSNLRGALVLAANWLAIFFILAVATRWPQPLVLLAALPLLAGRQLGLAVIMHECGHRTLFRSRGLNAFCGQWLAANIVLQDLPSYAAGHLEHHRCAGTAQDPDLPNYRNYPVSRDSFRRKIIRDLTGQTGFKLLAFVFRQAAGALRPESRPAAMPYVRAIAVNGVFAVALGLLFAPWAYALWLLAFLTVYMAIIRIRQIAEHAAVPDLLDTDPRANTRTTVPGWLGRMLFAPNRVNYHLEHHMLAAVPCYHLPAMHRLLRERGAFGNTRIFTGYLDVLRHAINPATAQ